MLSLPSTAALVFLIATAPIALLCAFSDLKRMKLPNVMVAALALEYVLIAPFVLDLEQYLWGLGHGVIMYFIGFFLTVFAGVGAGDSKFAAAASMFIPYADVVTVMMLLAAFLLGAFAAHRIARAIPAIVKATPDWKSWTHKKFPMGLALTGTMSAYFALNAFM